MKNSEFILTRNLADEPQQDMQLYDYCAPALASGNYNIATTQTIKWTERAVNETYSKDQSFLIEGPRFAVDPSVVYSIFPPAAATGHFESVLPNIVFNRKTLPWERTVNDQPPVTPPVSWLALLVFTEDEIAGVFSTTFEKVVNPGPGIFGPQNLQSVTELERQSPCMAVDVPADLFNKTVPSSDDLCYLTHCREVDMAYKELRSDVEEGWFSVVIANRFPTPGKRNYACLVSLEGFGDNLYGHPVPTGTYSTVRLAVLATWSFTGAVANDENFSQLMTNLNACSMRLPNQPAKQDTDAEKLVAAAFHDGYVAMNYLTRFGEETAAWFRGPCTPVQLSEVAMDPFFSAEAAMVYDQTTGLFDVSYAVAWQIGRLLAMSDKEFAVALMNWRKQLRTDIQVAAAQQRAAVRLGGILTSAENESPRDRRYITRQLEQYLIGPFAKKVAPAHGTGTPLIRAADYTGLMHRLHELPGVLSKEQLLAVLEKGPDLKEGLRSVLFNNNSFEKL